MALAPLQRILSLWGSAHGPQASMFTKENLRERARFPLDRKTQGTTLDVRDPMPPRVFNSYSTQRSRSLKKFYLPRRPRSPS